MVNLKSYPLILVAALFIVSCSSDNKTENKKTTPQANLESEQEGLDIEYKMSGIPYTLDGKPATIAGITFTPASQWQDFGASGMRAANYSYGPLENDKDSAVLAVFYFGKGKGGGIEANFQRWVKQMSLPDGRDPSTAAIRYDLKIDGMDAHVLTLYGIYNESMGGPMSQSKTVPRENYRLVAIIVEAPDGNVFFKLTGPDYTARIMIEAFMPMIKGIKKVT